MFCFMLAFLTVGYSSPHGPQTTQKTDMVSIQEHVTIDLATVDAPICNYACNQVAECSHVPVPAMLKKVDSIFDIIKLGSYIYCPPDIPIDPFSIMGVIPLTSKRVHNYPRPVGYHT